MLLQTAPKDASGNIIVVDAQIAPTHYSNALPYGVGGLAVDYVSAISHRGQGGLPFTANGRLATVDAAPAYFGNGIMPLASASTGRLCTGTTGVSVVNGSVGYTTDGRVAVTGGGGPIGVTIIQQPQNQFDLPAGFNAQFSITAIGTAPITYQWQKSTNGVLPYNNINDAAGPNGYSGTATNSLTVISVTAASQGFFRCIASNIVNSETSQSGQLTLSG
jgi:hypothetical protein